MILGNSYQHQPATRNSQKTFIAIPNCFKNKNLMLATFPHTHQENKYNRRLQEKINLRIRD